MKDKISLEEFLNAPKTENLLFIVEPIENDETKVKITPWIDEVEECNCECAIVVNKSDIEGIVPTGKFHSCCGKRLKIVEIVFVDNTSISVTDILKMIIEKGKMDFKKNSQRSVHLSNNDQKVAKSDINVHRRRDKEYCGDGYYYDPDSECCCYDQINQKYFVRPNSGNQSCYYVCGGPLKKSQEHRNEVISDSNNLFTQNCNGNACNSIRQTSFQEVINGINYNIIRFTNLSNRPIRINVSFMFGWQCMSPSTFIVEPGTNSDYANAGYCNSFSANFA